MMYKGMIWFYVSWMKWLSYGGKVWIRTLDVVTSLPTAERLIFSLHYPLHHSFSPRLFFQTSSTSPGFSSIHLSSFKLPLFLFCSNSTLSILFILSDVWLIFPSCLFSGCRCSAKWWNLRWITFFRPFPRRHVSAAYRKSLCCSAAQASVRSTDVCVLAGTTVKDKWHCVRTAYDGFLLSFGIFLKPYIMFHTIEGEWKFLTEAPG